MRYSFESVQVTLRFGVTTQIAVSAGYTGTIGGAIGIGSTVADVETYGGTKVTLEHGTRYLVPGAAGWCFDARVRTAEDGTPAGSEGRVSAVIVFAPAPLPL